MDSENKIMYDNEGAVSTEVGAKVDTNNQNQQVENVGSMVDMEDDIDYSQLDPMKHINIKAVGIVLAVIVVIFIVIISVFNNSTIMKIEKLAYEKFEKNIDLNKDDMDGQSWSEYEQYIEYTSSHNRLNNTDTRTIDNFRVSEREKVKIPRRIEGFN